MKLLIAFISLCFASVTASEKSSALRGVNHRKLIDAIPQDPVPTLFALDAASTTTLDAATTAAVVTKPPVDDTDFVGITAVNEPVLLNTVDEGTTTESPPITLPFEVPPPGIISEPIDGTSTVSGNPIIISVPEVTFINLVDNPVPLVISGNPGSLPNSGSGEPVWWPSVQANYEGVNIKRCFKRSVAPEQGASCAPSPKTCFFGTKECEVFGPAPEVRCFCSGTEGEQTWSCADEPCPPVV